MNSFDLTLFNLIHTPAGRWFLLDWLAIVVAVYLGYLMIIFFLVLVAKERDRKRKAYAFAWWALSAIASRGIIAPLFYFFYKRLRPFEALGIDTVFAPSANSALPSGHMAFYATFILPAFHLNKKWGWMYAGAVAGMGVARIYGAVHWPTDIIAGFAIAIAVSYGVKYALFRGTAALEKNEEEVVKTVE